ncbi:Acyltransferase [Sulfitobacter noctilucae]|uniref:lysophospholipid acyltransferase family protein n=1 Tax=Sulfitobacter noctilucae TaxID=1342302 RepID=UPI0004694E73|nr:lysophospholipid acyltransferase family protein [Sulfitobacter noctilucae]KIN61146.1 Acyltransferase [Sulfitobacter noctilucae]
MSQRWDSVEPGPVTGISPAGWARVVLKGGTLALLVFGGLALLLLVRLVERPVYGLHRPLTPGITTFVCRWALRIIGLRHQINGTPMTGHGAVLANHTSWLDIFVLNAAKRVYFVSKSEVAGWPGIGWLARATGTMFIERNPARAREQTERMGERLLAGHRLLFFPEGTSTDGMQVLPFKSTLFQSFFADDLKEEIAVQPVTVNYREPHGTDPRIYGWWGDASFGAHLLVTLAQSPQGRVDVTYHTPLNVRDFSNRKDLTKACERAVRAGHQATL